MVRKLMMLGGFVILLATIGVVDHRTGIELNFFAFYFIPIALAAWFVGQRTALVMAIAAGATWFTSDLLSTVHYSSPFYLYWNTGVRLIAFLVTAFLVDRVHRDLVYMRLVNERLNEAVGQVKQLTGLLPMCSSCKKIRRKDGSWEQIEQYITEHSDVDFSHSICPECMQKLYPDYTKRKALEPGFPRKD